MLITILIAFSVPLFGYVYGRNFNKIMPSHNKDIDPYGEEDWNN